MQSRLPQAIKAFEDNYIWLLFEPNSKQALVVDPGEAKPVLDVLTKNGLSLSSIFVTHHHYDHSGGVQALVGETGATVYGPKGATNVQTQIKTLDLNFSVLEIPGHTLDHLAFVGKILNDPILFCGDTLFTGGCGRLFEGTHAQMLQSLQKLKNLDPNTLIYCGHEYTEANLKFAQLLEPNNLDLQKRFEEVREKRQKSEPTVPSRLSVELKTNPFLRTDQPTIIQAAEKHAGIPLKNEVEVFTIIRQWKNELI